MTGPRINRSTGTNNNPSITTGTETSAHGDQGQAKDRREAIVAAAARVFQSHGLAGASMRLIAREAGCTTGAIYPHFGGKEALYAEVLAQSLRALYDSVRRAVQEVPEPRRGRAAVQAFYDYYRAHPLELSLGLYLYQGARPVGLSRDLDHALNRSLESVFRVITEALAAGGHDQPRMRATGGVSHAVGVLIMNQTGRLKVLGTDPDEQMAFYLQDL